MLSTELLLSPSKAPGVGQRSTVWEIASSLGPWKSCLAEGCVLFSCTCCILPSDYTGREEGRRDGNQWALPVQNKRASRENTGPHNNLYVKVYTALFIITPIQRSSVVNQHTGCGTSTEKMLPKSQLLIHMKWKWKTLSHVWVFATPWTVHGIQFSRPECWSGQPIPSPADLPNPGIESGSPALQVDSLPAEPPGKPTDTHSDKDKSQMLSFR